MSSLIIINVCRNFKEGLNSNVDALKIKYFLETHFSQTLIFKCFVFWSIECLQVNRVCTTRFRFHRKLRKEAKYYSYKLYLYTYTIYHINRLLEGFKWTFEEVFIYRLHFTATFFVTNISDNFHVVTLCHVIK